MRFASLLLGLTLLAPAASDADSLRCGNALITRGDHLLRVLHACGEPDLSEEFAVLGARHLHAAHLRAFTSVHVPITVRIWTYNLGPNRFMRRLRFDDGTLQRIETLNYGY